MIERQPVYKIYLFLFLVSSLLFIPFLGQVPLFDWDELSFAEAAREMIVTGNFLEVQTNYTLFWEKPPLFFWVQALSMKLFGVNEFAARFPNALIGVISSLLLFRIGSRLYTRKMGLLWVLVYTCSFFPFFYFKSGIIDPLFNLFIFLGIYQFYLFATLENKKLLHVFLSALFIGLGTLTKGPVSLLLLLLTASTYMILHKRYKDFFSWKVLLIYFFTYVFVGGFWFILYTLMGNYTIVRDFVEYMIYLLNEKYSGHGGFFGYHFVVLLLGVFPASVFAIRAMKLDKEATSPQRAFQQWMVILFWVVLLVFSIVKTKIVHYSSMCYYPMTFLATLCIHHILKGKIAFKKWMKILLTFLASLWALVLIALPLVEKYKEQIIASDLIKDDFAVGNLEASVHFPIIIPIIGVLFLLGIIYFSWFKNKICLRMFGVLLASLVFINVTVLLVVGRVEKYSQNVAVEFFKGLEKEDCYVATYRYKSFASFFYKKIPPYTNPKAKDFNWLVSKEVDKTIYVVSKNTNEAYFKETYPHFEHIKTENGFAFFVYKVPK